jgi:hypothetical protein
LDIERLLRDSQGSGNVFPVEHRDVRWDGSSSFFGGGDFGNILGERDVVFE